MWRFVDGKADEHRDGAMKPSTPAGAFQAYDPKVPHGTVSAIEYWSTTLGAKRYILDNLIAAGKARPMIVVMPFGHTPDRPGTDLLTNQDFGDDLSKDLIPYVEANFRTLNGPATRAMAGLSMGGAHTLRFGLTHAERFGYVGCSAWG